MRVMPFDSQGEYMSHVSDPEIHNVRKGTCQPW